VEDFTIHIEYISSLLSWNIFRCNSFLRILDRHHSRVYISRCYLFLILLSLGTHLCLDWKNWIQNMHIEKTPSLVNVENPKMTKIALFVHIFMTYMYQITILVAAKGAHKLPTIYGAEDMKKALQKLRTVLSSQLLVLVIKLIHFYTWINVISSTVITPSSIFLQAGKVLWTPQNEDETLTKQQLLEDYPQLADCMKTFLVKKHEWNKCLITFSVLNYFPNLNFFFGF